MKRTSILTLLAAAGLVLAAPAWAQSAQVEATSWAEAAGKAMAETKNGQASGDARARAEAQAHAKADLEAQKRLEAIKEKGAKASAEARARAEAKLEAAARAVEKESATKGEMVVASRLAGEFDLTAEALLEEREELGVSFGELMIAHTLEANSELEVTVEDLFDLRAEGMGWGQIAAGLDLNLGEVVSAVNAEARVADGSLGADGKVAGIGSARASASAGASVAAGAGVRAGTTGARVGAGTGVGADAGAGAGVSLPGVRVGGR